MMDNAIWEVYTLLHDQGQPEKRISKSSMLEKSVGFITALKEENTALKEENTALKEEETALKEENTALKEENIKLLKEENTALKEENMKLLRVTEQNPLSKGLQATPDTTTPSVELIPDPIITSTIRRSG